MAVKRKEQSIETLRGIAIILMVAGHVIGHNNSSGLKINDDSFWRYFYYSFEYLRMPLFTAISGFVYALKPVQEGSFKRFFMGKSRRILLPLISVASVQYILNALVPNVNNPVPLGGIWRIFIFSYAQFWFLQALFLVFITIILLEKYKIIASLHNWLITITISTLVLFILNPIFLVRYFSFYNYLYLLPFFLLGLGLNRFKDDLFKKPIIIAVSTILILGIIVQQLSWFELLNLNSGRFNFLGVIVGFTGIWIIFRFRRPNRWLAWLGYYSYGIYLFHVFGTAGSRIFAKILGIESNFMLFIVGIMFGLGFPIVLEYFLLKSSLLRRAFLGLK